MADTTNYGWTKPTVSGSSGAWGTLLNTALDDIDTDLKAVSDASDAIGDRVTDLEDEKDVIPPLYWNTMGKEQVAVGSTAKAGVNANSVFTNGAASFNMNMPLDFLKPGQVIGTIESRGTKGTTGTCAVALQYIDESGNVIPLQTVTNTSSTTTESANVQQTVIAGRLYILTLALTQIAGGTSAIAYWARPVMA